MIWAQCGVKVLEAIKAQKNLLQLFNLGNTTQRRSPLGILDRFSFLKITLEPLNFVPGPEFLEHGIFWALVVAAPPLVVVTPPL